MDVPAGLVIRDSRIKNGKHYDAVENGILSFADGHIDLMKQKWLQEKVYGGAGTYSKPKEQLAPLARIILTSIDAVIFVIVVAIVIIMKFRSPPLILLPLLAAILNRIFRKARKPRVRPSLGRQRR